MNGAKRVILFWGLVFLLAVPLQAQEPENVPASYGLTADEESSFSVRGQLCPVEQTVLSSEISANILQFNFQEGEGFQKDQLLARLDCAVYEAQLKKAEAAATSSRKILEVNRELNEMDINSVVEMEQAAAKSMEADANRELMKVTVKKCAIRAPFSGRVVERYVEPHQYVKPGDPLLMIVNPDLLEVRIIVPSKWLSWLKVGSHFSFYVASTGRAYPAAVIRIGAQIDPVSQSVPVMAAITVSDKNLLPGLDGVAQFAPEQ